MFDSLNWTNHMSAAFDLSFHGGGLWGRCFFIPVDSGRTLEECEQLLAGCGIEIYARDTQQGYFLFWVDHWDAERAYNILTQAGVPIGIAEEVDYGT